MRAFGFSRRECLLVLLVVSRIPSLPSGAWKPGSARNDKQEDRRSRESFLRAAQRQFQAEAGADALRVVTQRQRTAEQPRPALGQRQPQTDAARRHVGAVTATERPEDRAPLAFWHARAAILHLDHEPLARDGSPDPDVPVLGALAVLAGIVDQV